MQLAVAGIVKLATAVVKMNINLFDYQKEAIDKLKTGSILCGGVGSGKSRTAIYYYFQECGGKIKVNGAGEYVPMKKQKDLYIITTARKRDTLEWERELGPFLLSTNQKISINRVKVIVDSWNNIGKYTTVKNSFFIFDEQRVIGSGKWVKSFLKITKTNKWIILSATPGDTWSDYIPVFIANGFYKNRTEFVRRHVVYSRFTKFPKVDHYVDCGYLVRLRNKIVIPMRYIKATTAHNKKVIAPFDKNLFNRVIKERWNVFENKPIKNVSELCYTMRKVVNSDLNRLMFIKQLLKKHSKIIVFYNFNYELNLLKTLNGTKAEWNGHKHEPIPTSDSWLYLVQYTAGAEGWNCTETNCIVFYSQNYSYKIMVQAAGRIDRLNTSFSDLYYYHIISNSKIDTSISKSLENKQNFNEKSFTTRYKFIA
jgi:hypothetical protein